MASSCYISDDKTNSLKGNEPKKENVTTKHVRHPWISVYRYSIMDNQVMIAIVKLEKLFKKSTCISTSQS